MIAYLQPFILLYLIKIASISGYNRNNESGKTRANLCNLLIFDDGFEEENNKNLTTIIVDIILLQNNLRKLLFSRFSR